MITRFDSLILIISIALVGQLYLHFWTGDYDYSVTIRDNAGTHTLQLVEDGVVQLPGKLGNSTLEIKDRQIRFTDSPCTSKYCIHSGWLTSTQPVIACVPNGILLSLNEKIPFDAINF